MAYDKTGYLTVRAYTAGGAYPVSDSVVKIFGAESEKSDSIYSLITDIDGIIKEIPLPAPSKDLSTASGAFDQAYALYNLEITSAGYYPKHIYNIPIFEGINAVQLINMIPKDDRENGITYPKDTLDTYIYENEKLETRTKTDD